MFFEEYKGYRSGEICYKGEGRKQQNVDWWHMMIWVGDWKMGGVHGSQNISKGRRKVPGGMVNFAEVEVAFVLGRYIKSICLLI